MIRKLFICYCILSFLRLGTAQAMFIPEVNNREDNLKKIQIFLELKLVQYKLSRPGLSKDEIQERVKQLDDEQIHQLASQIRGLEAGGGNDAQESLDAMLMLFMIALFVVVALVAAVIWVAYEATKEYYDLPPNQREKIKDREIEIGKDEQE